MGKSVSKHRLKKQKWSALDIAVNVFVVLLALVNLFSLYWMFVNSFQFTYKIVKIPPELFPSSFTLDNYSDLFKGSNAILWLMNSLTISVLVMIFTLLVSSMAAYAFAKMRFTGRKVLFIILISTLMVPKEIIFVPLYITTKNLGLIGTLSSMILPNLGFPLGMFLLKQFYESIPETLREAARIDGCSEFMVYFRIILPLGKAGLSALGIMTFINTWNDYLWQLLMTTKDKLKTLPIGVAALQQQINPNYALRLAGASLSAIPMIILFLIFQKSFSQGLTIGAIKE